MEFNSARQKKGSAMFEAYCQRHEGSRWNHSFVAEYPEMSIDQIVWDGC